MEYISTQSITSHFIISDKLSSENTDQKLRGIRFSDGVFWPHPGTCSRLLLALLWSRERVKDVTEASFACLIGPDSLRRLCTLLLHFAYEMELDGN